MRVADKNRVQGVGGIVLKDAIPRRDKLWIFYPRLLQLNLLLTGALAANITNGYDIFNSRAANVVKIHHRSLANWFKRYDGSMVNGLQLLDTWQNYFGSPEGAKLGLLVSIVGYNTHGDIG